MIQTDSVFRFPKSTITPVGAPRLELGTSALSGLRSNQLSYAPGGGRLENHSAAGKMLDTLSFRRFTTESAILDRPVKLSNANSGRAATGAAAAGHRSGPQASQTIKHSEIVPPSCNA